MRKKQLLVVREEYLNYTIGIKEEIPKWQLNYMTIKKRQ